MKYIIVRLFDNVKVLFEEDFINNNEFRTQNEIIEVLSKLFDRKDFSVDLCFKESKEEK